MSADDLLWVGILIFFAMVAVGHIVTERDERRRQRRELAEHMAELRRAELERIGRGD